MDRVIEALVLLLFVALMCFGWLVFAEYVTAAAGTAVFFYMGEQGA